MLTEYACPRRELSCIVGNLFVELEPPCDHCAAGDSLTICGTTYAGTRATATVIGFYSWKAKAENVVKIKKANQEETEGMPVDLNNVQP